MAALSDDKRVEQSVVLMVEWLVRKTAAQKAVSWVADWVGSSDD